MFQDGSDETISSSSLSENATPSTPSNIPRENKGRNKESAEEHESLTRKLLFKDESNLTESHKAAAKLPPAKSFPQPRTDVDMQGK